jgi:hypothetical protein
VPRRIEIELTSARPDGTWTWRAAGAREPKGVLDGGLLHEGAKAGDVLRAEAEFELEGIVITSVAAPKTDNRQEAQRIEIVGPGRPEGPGVTTQLVGRSDRRDRRRDDDDRRRERGPGRPPARDGGRPRREGAPSGGPDRGGRPRREGDDRRAPGGDRAGRDRAGGDGTRKDSPEREGARRPPREGGGGRPPRPEGDRRPAGAVHTSSQADRNRARRLNPGSTHRKAVMESLPPEQQPVAEQLLRGGIPAVRTALHLEREKAEAEGRPAPNAEALMALAESLLPRLRAAEWRDRAEAAVAAKDDASMRDLRSVLAGADLARDDESRALAATLREAVDARVAKLHESWTADIRAQLDSGRVVRAVRLSARPPDAGARLDPELTERLTEAASATMAPETPADLWAAILEAVAESPIRRSVTPTGLPADAPPELRKAAHQYSGTIPALAKMLGVTIPPPPAPTAGRRRTGAGGPRPDGGRPKRPPRTEKSGGGESRGGPAPAAEPAHEAAAETSPEVHDAAETPPAAEAAQEAAPETPPEVQDAAEAPPEPAATAQGAAEAPAEAPHVAEAAAAAPSGAGPEARERDGAEPPAAEGAEEQPAEPSAGQEASTDGPADQ